MADKLRRWLLSSAASGIVGGLAYRAVEDFIWSVDKKENIQGPTREIVRALFGEVLPTIPEVYAGEGNPLKADSSGNPLGLSHFMKMSSHAFSNLISSAFDLSHRELDLNDPVADYKPYLDAFILGGPPSNSAAREILGYRTVEIMHLGKRTFMPIRRNDLNAHPLRWYQDYGISGWGTFEDGQQLLANRYDKAKLVTRPIYRMYDRKENRFMYPRVTGGLLYEEWLTIVKIQHAGATKLLIGGLHGHSSEAFVRGNSEFIRNLETLIDKTEKIPEFQMIVPVTLEHKIDLTGNSVTRGLLNWDSAELEPVNSSA